MEQSMIKSQESFLKELVKDMLFSKEGPYVNFRETIAGCLFFSLGLYAGGSYYDLSNNNLCIPQTEPVKQAIEAGVSKQRLIESFKAAAPEILKNEIDRLAIFCKENRSATNFNCSKTRKLYQTNDPN